MTSRPAGLRMISSGHDGPMVGGSFVCSDDEEPAPSPAELARYQRHIRRADRETLREIDLGRVHTDREGITEIDERRWASMMS